MSIRVEEIEKMDFPMWRICAQVGLSPFTPAKSCWKIF
ncbi:hypothetical protein GGI1_17743 [Acidithiobacillus sp. GGI-221]|nr:hypothetical protein GGI1_17743 [Acidithiobacillus sp. GGI-221]